MEKQTAINLLGGTPALAAKAMGYKAVQTIYMWPNVLPQSIADQVVGASSRIAKAGKKQKQPPALANIAQGATNSVAEGH